MYKKNRQPCCYFLNIGLPYDNEEGDDYEISTDRSDRKDINHPAHISKIVHGNVVNITWQPADNAISKDGKCLFSVITV